MSSDPHAAPALARWLGALRAGALPDNAQAYAALHAVAAHLDGLAATTSEAPAPSVAPEAPPRARPALNPRTREVLTELAAAARDAAKWLYGGRQAPREERLVDTRDAAERERDEAPRGNENEQWQRLIWLVRRASVSVDVDVGEWRRMYAAAAAHTCRRPADGARRGRGRHLGRTYAARRGCRGAAGRVDDPQRRRRPRGAPAARCGHRQGACARGGARRGRGGPDAGRSGGGQARA
jgi:hypothetical protein